MGLFDKMTEAIGSAGKDVVKIAKEASDVSKCTAVIEECERNIRKICANIGECYYKNHPENLDEQYIAWFSAIDRNKELIGEMQEKKRKLKGIEFCAKCGAELKKGAKFCNACGAQVALQAESEIKETHCLNCGAALNGNEKFCAVCGSKVCDIGVIDIEADVRAEK